MKFGAYYFHLKLRPEQPDNARGAFTYTGQFTGNAMADFLLGYPTSAVSGIGRGDEDGRTNWLHLYVQDDWQARPNLTINAGLRYEYQPAHVRRPTTGCPRSTSRCRAAGSSSPATRTGRSTRAPATSCRSSRSRTSPPSFGWGRGLLDPSAVRLAPRLGFALSLNDSRAVIRGGYGIFLNQWAYSVQTAFARNLPFFFTKQVDVPSDVRGPDAADPQTS